MGHPLNEQQLAALDRHLHCAVLANAGSGKTRILIERFLRIIVLDGVSIETVVAITFTKAAAAEMRTRIYERIEELLAKPTERNQYHAYLSDNELVTRLHELSRSLAKARISTFHSFCAGLVRQYADVVGIAYDVRDAEERESSAILSSAVSSVLHDVLKREHPLYESLSRCLEQTSIETIETLIHAIARDRSRTFSAIELLAKSTDELLVERRLRTASIRANVALTVLRPLEAALSTQLSIPCFHACHERCIDLITRIETHGYDEQSCDAMIRLKQDFLTDKLRYSKNKLDKRAKEEKAFPDTPEYSSSFAELLTSKWSDSTETTLIEITMVIARLGVMSSKEFTRRKRSRNVIDFDDMIYESIRLLEDPDIQKAVRLSISHIMIDEFQDTDPTQFRILELIAPDIKRPGETGPMVFIVGDDKQSIYQFRNADVRLFREARRAIATANHRTLTDDGMRLLTKSFRMHPDLCDAVNTMCSAFFLGSEIVDNDPYGYDVPYELLDAGLELDRDPTLPRVHVICVPPKDSGTGEDDDLPISEAEHVARAIVEALHRNRTGSLRPKDIGVLVPKNEFKASIAQALRSYGIPFTIYGGRSFFSRPEIADLRNALLACIEQTNNLATASVMRSPLLRCSDLDITRAALRGRASSIQDGLYRLVGAGEASPLQVQAYTFFTMFSQQLESDPAFLVIDRMLEHTSWHRTIASELRYDQMVANVDKLVSICRDVTLQGGKSHYDVIRAIDTGDSDTEAEGVVLSDDDAVHIMTLHGAKGLEFDVVVIAGLSSKSRSDSYVETSEFGLTISMPTEFRNVSDPSALEDQPLSISHLCNKWIANIRRTAEDRRLLYVALTRAKHELVLSLPDTWQEKPQSGRLGMLQAGVQAYGRAQEHRYDLSLPADPISELREASAKPVDMTLPIDPLPTSMITPSALVEYHPSTSAYGNAMGANIGTAIHDAIALLIKQSLLLDDESLMERIVQFMLGSGFSRKQAQTAAEEVYTTLRSQLVLDKASEWPAARIEQQLAIMQQETLLHGYLDVRFAMRDGVIEVWDWKTNAVTNEADILRYGEQYRGQMKAYAEMCLAAHPDCTSVRTTLVFTKAILKGITATYTVDHNRTAI